MNRRSFLLASTATLIAGPALAMIDYTPGLIASELAEGKTVFVDFAADWCSTCARQARVINALRAENPDYDANISFIRVDWDDHRRADITTNLSIPRRSTLVVLKGNQELGRVVAGTSRGAIQGLMDTALTAATA